MVLLPASQNKRRLLIRTAMIALGLGLLACAIAARFWGAPVHGLTVAILVAFCALAVLELSVFDELAKQSHYVAWYWGSLLGLIAVAAAQVLLTLGRGPFGVVRGAIVDRLGDASPVEALLMGMMATPLLMGLGFVLVRGASWLRGR